MGNRQEAAEKLRQTREAKKITLEEAQNRTKIHIGVLRTLEKGETPRNVNPIYLKGFLKIYAGFLGLDPKAIVDGFNLDLPPAEERQIKQRAEPSKKELNLSLQDPVSHLRQWLKGLEIRKILIPLLVIILLVVIWKVVHRKSRLAAVEPVGKLAAVVEQPVKEESVPVKKSSQIKLAIRAKDNSWLHVKSDGKTLFKGVLRRGMSETWAAKDKIELSIGDAGAVELEVNGERTKPLGRRRETVKNIKITHDGISVGTAH